jgi:hypothetical protein
MRERHDRNMLALANVRNGWKAVITQGYSTDPVSFLRK